MYYLQVAKSQNDKKKEIVVATQLMYAIATAASNLLQWLGPHWLRSLSISTVIPAAAQAPANVIVEVTQSPTTKRLTIRGFRRLRFVSNA